MLIVPTTGYSMIAYLPSMDVTCNEMYACVFALLTNVIFPEGTAGGNVPYVRMVKVGIKVDGTAASVAVVVESAGPLVAVPGVVVRSGIAVKVDGEDSVKTGTGDASTNVIGVSVATGVSVGGAEVIVG